MAWIDEIERQGHFLFRYRGQFPLVLFLCAVPFIWYTDYSVFDLSTQVVLKTLSVLITLLGFSVRAIAIGTTPGGTSGRNRDRQVAESLNTTGIYSCVRHPLYLGNYLMWSGIVAYTYSPCLFVIITLVFWLYYERIMYAEECFLEKQFGETFRQWAAHTPAFIPSFRHAATSKLPFSLKAVLRREYSGMFAAVFGFVFVDLVRDFFHMHPFRLRMGDVYVLVAAGLLSLLLRTLKHRTALLSDPHRD